MSVVFIHEQTGVEYSNMTIVNGFSVGFCRTVGLQSLDRHCKKNLKLVLLIGTPTCEEGTPNSLPTYKYMDNHISLKKAGLDVM